MKARYLNIFFQSIRGRLWLLLLAVFLPMLAVQGYFYAGQFHKMREQALQNNIEIAHVTSKAFSLFIEDILHQETAIGIGATASPAMSPKDFQNLLLEAAEACYSVNSFSWLSPEGKVLVSSNPIVLGENFGDRDFCHRIRSGCDWTVSNLITDLVEGDSIFLIARRVRDLAGNLQGMVVAAINADYLSHVFGIDRSRQACICVLDRKGAIVYRHPALRPVWEDNNWLWSLPGFQGTLEGAESTWIRRDPNDGKMRITAMVPVGMTGWAVAAYLGEDEATGPILAALAWSVFLFLVVTLGSCVLALGLARSITLPLMMLRRNACSFGKGEFTARAVAGGPIEIRELSETLGCMAERIRNAVEEARMQAGNAEHSRKSLEASEELFRLTFDQAPIGAAIVGPDFRFQRVNAQLCKILGYPADELRMLTFADVTYSEDAAENLEQSGRVLTGEQEVYQSDRRFLRKDGGIVWARLSVRQLRNAGGTPIALLPMMEDISETKRAEDELWMANERVRDIMESITDAFVGIDRMWRYTYVNSAAEKYLLRNRAELLGRDMREINPQPEADMVQYERAMSGLAPVSFETYSAQLEMWFEVRAYPSMEGLSIYFRDISQRKQMEDVLKKSRETLSSILRAAPIGIGLVRDRCFQWVNEQFTVITGYTRQELVGNNGMGLYARKREFERVGILMYRDQCKHGVGSVETEWRRKDGEKVAILLNSAALDPSDIRAGVVFTASDITEQRRIEEEVIRSRNELELRVRERTAELELANCELRQIPAKLISAQEEERKRIGGELHDSIGQTLAALKYWVEMILLERDRGKPEAGLQKLEQFIATLQRSIEETRAIYMGLRPTMLESMGVIATLHWLRREFHKLYPKQHIEMIVTIEEETIPDTLKVVIFRITQEAINNISKHSNAEWVDIFLGLRGNAIELSIVDDGTGFDVEKTLSQAHGKSLGLIGMKERAEIVGGMFHIASVPGEGTTIRATWPVAALDPCGVAAACPEEGLGW